MRMGKEGYERMLLVIASSVLTPLTVVMTLPCFFCLCGRWRCPALIFTAELFFVPLDTLTFPLSLIVSGSKSRLTDGAQVFSLPSFMQPQVFPP